MKTERGEDADVRQMDRADVVDVRAVQRLDDQLDADEGQNDRQADVRVDDPLQQAARSGSRAAAGPSARRAFAVKTITESLGQAEDRRDGVEREQHVGGADAAMHDHQRGQDALARSPC